MKKAEYYEARPDGRVVCKLCPHSCVAAPEETGFCGVRRNLDGVLWAESYGRITALALDPIEKKPLRRFMPGSHILSLGGYGCSFRCDFCQNHRISIAKAPYETVPPHKVAALSRELADRGNIGVAYTYNEPLIGYEFVYDCARLVAGQNQKNVLVTNGYIQKEPLAKLLPLIHAMNIDLKSFQPGFYKAIGGDLQTVQGTIERAAGSCHVEVTTLIVPGKNDTIEEMDTLAGWLAGASPDIPLHVSRFFPAHHMQDTPATPLEVMYRLAEAARGHLRHVYLGNC